eukprot:TRINITY_DN4320_c0_g1_i1.p1 TRINITY_DN4320_c0_g1~~TRINITY_DN4320_c0_g1_i1.p1  ORF type:complete len:146 (-),score=28.44 TRINITY_DN4320_c0_g1_i1:93-530(-)
MFPQENDRRPLLRSIDHPRMKQEIEASNAQYGLQRQRKKSYAVAKSVADANLLINHKHTGYFEKELCSPYNWNDKNEGNRAIRSARPNYSESLRGEESLRAILTKTKRVLKTYREREKKWVHEKDKMNKQIGFLLDEIIKLKSRK